MRLRYGNHRQAKVLVIDNERTHALRLSAILQQEGYSVSTACSGEEAVETARCFLPDLLVSDIVMGAMNGVEAAVRIMTIQPACRVLFMSDHGFAQDVLSAAPEYMAYSCIAKPLHPIDLINAVAYKLSAVHTADDAEVASAASAPPNQIVTVSSLPESQPMSLEKKPQTKPELRGKDTPSTARNLNRPAMAALVLEAVGLNRS